MNPNPSPHCSVQSRRRFLSNCSRASLAIALAPLLLSKAEAARPQWLDAARRIAHTLGYRNFASQLHTVFRSSSANLTLIEATDLSRTASPDVLENRNPADEMFSLTFVGPANPILPQGTYTFSHKKLGTFPMFIVPAAFNEQVIYLASFNRINFIG